MFGLLSQQSKFRVMSLNDDRMANINGNGSYGGNGDVTFSSGGGIAPSTPLPFDFDLSQIEQAVRRGNTERDIRSAYEVFTTGYSSGRGYGYAQDIQRRFAPGLLQTYGATDIRTAAANYLDSAGLPRLASFVSPQKELVATDGQYFPLPVGPETTVTTTVTTPKNPFEILADILPKLFGNAVYNPPLQQQAYGYTSATSQQPLTQVAGRGNIGLFIIIGIIGVIAYFLYKRFA